jgi:hypothetical protein
VAEVADMKTEEEVEEEIEEVGEDSASGGESEDYGED